MKHRQRDKLKRTVHPKIWIRSSFTQVLPKRFTYDLHRSQNSRFHISGWGLKTVVVTVHFHCMVWKFLFGELPL